jgi:peptidyl-tRNA hydrolase
MAEQKSPIAEPKLYVVVNTDHEMSAGKVGAQVGHAVSRLYIGLLAQEQGEDPTEDPLERALAPWWRAGSPIIVLGGTTQEIAALGPPDIVVTDAGRTEVRPGAQTAVAWRPTERPLEGLRALRLLEGLRAQRRLRDNDKTKVRGG